MALNLHHLRVFFTVIEQQSFSGAARVLFISQPAVSKAVRELELQTGLDLIERTAGGPRGGICLTDNGAALFEHARGIFGLERAAIEDVQNRIGLKEGRLVVGASFTIASYWLPSYVASFTRQYPTIDLHVRVGNTRAIRTELIECNIDIGLVEGTVDDPRVVSSHWRDDELCIVSRPGSTLSQKRLIDADELSKETWLLRENGSGTRDVSERVMREHGIRPRRMIEFGSNVGIARAVAEGAGMAILPTTAVRELIRLGELAAVDFPAEKLVRPLYRLQLRERSLSPLAAAFYRLLEN